MNKSKRQELIDLLRSLFNTWHGSGDMAEEVADKIIAAAKEALK